MGPRDVLLGLGAGGICGSDLHYYKEGKVGAFVIREPLVPGHEASGIVQAIGTDVTRVKPGDRVAINPQPSVRPLRLLPRRSRQPLPQDVLSGQRKHLSACAGHVPRKVRDG